MNLLQTIDEKLKVCERAKEQPAAYKINARQFLNPSSGINFGLRLDEMIPTPEFVALFEASFQSKQGFESTLRALRDAVDALEQTESYIQFDGTDYRCSDIAKKALASIAKTLEVEE